VTFSVFLRKPQTFPNNPLVLIVSCSEQVFQGHDRFFSFSAEYLENRGIAPNVASFIGTATPRICFIGHEYRAPMPKRGFLCPVITLHRHSTFESGTFLPAMRPGASRRVFA
jgi:hypothetical protein